MQRKTWRIQQLQSIVAEALESADYDGPNSNRVRRVPDARTIRYYTTIGLLDRPAEMQGRTAFYDRRHVLQLVCIKRLQASGLSLSEVQTRLAGATSKQLREIANLPENFWDEPKLGAANPEPTTTSRAPSRKSFWAEPASPAKRTRSKPTLSPSPSIRLPVAVGVSLELQGVSLEQLTDKSLQSLQPLLNQLSRELENLGLISGESSAPQTPSAETEEE